MLIENNSEMVTKDITLIGSNITSNLTVLNVSNSNLEKLPKSFNRLRTIINLNLSNNKFNEIPEFLTNGMPFIQHLNFSYNNLRTFDKKLRCLKTLKSLYLNNNLLEHVPVWLMSRDKSFLTKLNISCNPCFHRKISTFQHIGPKSSHSVNTLYLSNTCFTDNNANFLKLFPNLKILFFNNNEIAESNNLLQEFPVNRTVSREIKELYLVSCSLSVISVNILYLNKLEILDLSNNKLLQWLPDEICKLNQLKIMKLSFCSIFVIPRDFGELSELRELFLDNNQLTSLPESFSKLTKLEILDLYNNEIEILPDLHKFTNLIYLDLSLNEFSIPENNFEIINSKIYANLQFNYRSKMNLKRESKCKIPIITEDVHDVTQSTESSSCCLSVHEEFEYVEEEGEINQLNENDTEEDWSCPVDTSCFDLNAAFQLDENTVSYYTENNEFYFHSNQRNAANYSSQAEYPDYAVEMGQFDDVE